MEVEYQYTSGGQIAKIIARDLTDGAGTDIYCQEFEYDVNGRKIRQVQKEKESDADTAAYYVTTFAYDSRDMLVEEKYQRWDSGNSAWDNMYWARYLYDTAGNMVSRVVDQIVNGNSKDYSDFGFGYSRGYQLTGFTRTIGPETRVFTLTYDANGNMTHIQQSATFTDTFYNITEMEFQFDEKNRMTHYRFGGSGSYCQIKYDALGRVRERVNLAPTTTKYYSDGRSLAQQLDSSDDIEFDYLRGRTGLMRQRDETGATKNRLYIEDTLGTVWALVDPLDLSVTHYNYNSWGEHLDKDDSGFPTDENLMRYIGNRIEDFGKGSVTQTDAIYHFNARHYIPIIQSFLQRDPLRYYKTPHQEMRLSMNPYMYSENNPVMKLDPTGLTPSCMGLSGAGGGNLHLVHGCFYNDCTFTYGKPAGNPTYCNCHALSNLFYWDKFWHYAIKIADVGNFTVEGIAGILSLTGYTGGLCGIGYSELPWDVKANPLLCCLVADVCFCESCMDHYTGFYPEHPFFADLTMHTNALECTQFVDCLLPFLIDEIYDIHYHGRKELNKLSFLNTCSTWVSFLIAPFQDRAKQCANLWWGETRHWPSWAPEWIGHYWIDMWLKDRPEVVIPLDVTGAWSDFGPGNQWWVMPCHIYQFMLSHMQKEAKW